ncbi:MAG: DUF2267 domain-containing protein [Myxococcales bacterium]|nr:DUF2267 domain-containing protein [Myxococcales bacterium]
MSYRTFVHAVAERAGIDAATAERVVAATLTVLGQRLRRVDAQAVAERLPAPLRRHLLASDYQGDLDAEELLRRTGSPDDRHPRAVVAVLAESLDEQARTQLRISDLRALLRA